MKRRILALLSMFTLLLVSCIDDTIPLNLKVTAEKSSVKVGEQIKLTASTSISDVTFYWKEGSNVNKDDFNTDNKGSSVFTTTKSTSGTYVFYVFVQSNDLTSEDLAVCTVKVTSATTTDPDDNNGDSDDGDHPNGVSRTYPIHSGINASTFWAGEGESDANHDISNVPSAWEADWATSFGVEDWPGLERDADHIPTDSRFTGDVYPKVNPYYFALPYNDMSDIVYDGSEVSAVANLQSDYTKLYDSDYGREVVRTNEMGSYFNSYWRKASSEKIPWKNDKSSWSDRSMVKGRWARIRYNGGEWVYAQWLDAGPYHYDDVDYVFGNSTPRNQNPNTGQKPYAGIDLSPSVMLKLGVVDELSEWQIGDWEEWGHNITGGEIDWQFVEAEEVPAGPWKRIVADNKTHW